MIKLFKFFLIYFFLVSCNSKEDLESKISSIQLELEIDRFDKKFYEANNFQLNNLKKKYPFFFPEQFHDTIWINRQNDSLQVLLQNEINRIFPSDNQLKNSIKELFKHLKYYFADFKAPRVITVVNNVDFQSKVIYNDSLLIISIDTFLGNQNKIYQGIPNYISLDMDLKYLTSNIVEEFSYIKIPDSDNRTLLSQIIYSGKKLYLKDLLIPNLIDEIKIGYSENQIKWVRENELFIWKYFIERDLLYSTHPSLKQRFIDPSPFSKFYLEIDNLSPGKVGQWIGWQIVRSYVKGNPDLSVIDIINASETKIFNKSNYKPSK